MLARLDELPGIEESRVDSAGMRFLVSLEPGADTETVVSSVLAALGPGSRRLSSSEAADAVAARRSGEPWMRCGETLRLSQEEARVLADRRGRSVAMEVGLDEIATRKFVSLFESELAAVFERAHAAVADPSAPTPARQDFVGRVIERCREFLNPEQSEAVAKSLKSRFGS